MAWTDPRTWVTDELVTAAIMNTHVRDNLGSTWHLLARKSADETVSASTALQSDDHLLFSVGASEVWTFDMRLIVVASSTTPDIQLSWSFPASGTMYFSNQAAFGPGGTASSDFRTITTSDATPIPLYADTTAVLFTTQQLYVNSTTAGTVTLRWAQNSSSGTTTLKTNSCLIGMKLA